MIKAILGETSRHVCFCALQLANDPFIRGGQRDG